MKKIYYLSTCDTCKKIIKSWEPIEDCILQDIKNEAITVAQLEEMQQLSGSYEALFSKRARLYKERNLKEKSLTESDIKALILEEYTFLKRPVLLLENKIFIGNSKKVVEAATIALHS